MDARPPFVRVVVVNFDGGPMTLDCLDSILATEWPPARLQVVLVDNGSIDDVAEVVGEDARYAAVTVLQPLANLGFAAGCNLGIELPGDPDYVALVNNDAVVDPAWLPHLAAVAVRHPDVGAVSAKMLLAERYHEAEIVVGDAGRLAPDPRCLGVRLTAVRVDGRPVADGDLAFDEGVHAAEVPDVGAGEELARWTSRRGTLRIPAGDGPAPRILTMALSSPVPRHAVVRTSRQTVETAVGPVPATVTVALDPEPVDVINNVGSNLFRGGFGGDRGFLETDRGQYEDPAEVFAWCGGGVLLRRAYLNDVGLFDERLFLYYEDTDLSWRGRLKGWRYLYEPAAIVRHRHAASTGVGSPVFRYYTERNRLLVLAKNAPAALAWRAALGELRRGTREMLHHYVGRPVRLRLPVWPEAAHRRNVLLGFARWLPSMLRARWTMRTSVRRRDLMVWETTK